ncbi:hypothetical protein [Catenuloplanes japonicus]|uniref:hypothetical protein n=1 Tax=Catenuloplanes japonicus TaxID=33876 RepID=UPI0005246274|nr:hypothetical protein [Catenuloplanes japonicus]
MRGLTVAALAVALAAGTTACSGGIEDDLGPSGGSTGGGTNVVDPLPRFSTWRGCEAEGAPLSSRGGRLAMPGAEQTGAPLPADMMPVAATICGVGWDGTGKEIHVEERVSGWDKLVDLAEALRLPDAPDLPAGGQECAGKPGTVPWLVVHDTAGNWVRPRIPVDRCGDARPEVAAAMVTLDANSVSDFG